MLPAPNRMRRSADYRAAVRTGRRAGRTSLVVHVAAGDDPDQPVRVGFVVSRAVGSAVTRNRVKRRLREAVRSRLTDLPVGSLVVVRANPASARSSWGALEQDLEQAMGRVLAARPTGVVQGSGAHRGERSGPSGVGGAV